MLDQFLLGVATNAFSEIIFSKVKRLTAKKNQLKSDLINAYNDSLNETEKKFRGSKPALERIFKNISVKRKMANPSGGKDQIVDFVKTYAKKTLRKKDSNIEIEEAISYFYNVFLVKVRNNPLLYNRLIEAYLNDLLRGQWSIKDVVNLLPEMKKKTDAIFDHLKEVADIFAVGQNNFPFHIGAFQLNIYGANKNAIVQALKSNYQVIKEKEGVRHILEVVDKNEKINSLKVVFNGELFRIVYPPDSKTIIWIDEDQNKLIFTCFAANYHKKADIQKSIQSYLSSGMIKEVTLNDNIVNLFKNYVGATTHLKYNPKIKRLIKIKKITHKIEGRIGILGGDAGFLKHPSIQATLDKIEAGGKGKIADVFFFKTKSISGIYAKSADFDFHRDGRIVGHIPRKNIDYDKVRESIYNFLIKQGRE